MVKRVVLSILFIIILTFSFILDVIPAFASSGSTVGTTTSTLGTGRSNQRKTFYANGRHWIFYSDGTNIGWRTSTNGILWSDLSVIAADVNGYDINLCFDGTYASYAFVRSAALYYRRGLPNIDGSITWSAAEQTVVSANVTGTSQSIAVDTSNHAYIYYRDTNTGNSLMLRNDNTDGTWSTSAGYPLAITVTGYAGRVIALTANKMYVVYTKDSTTNILGKYYDGATWGSAENVTAYNPSIGYAYSITNINDNVEVSYLRVTTNQLRVATRDSSTGIWSESLVVDSTSSDWYPTLTSDSSNLYLFWINSIDKHIYYKTRVGGTWSGATDWLDESGDGIAAGIQNCITSSYSSYSSYISVLYETKNASPYNVKYSYISITTISTLPVTNVQMTPIGTLAQLNGSISSIVGSVNYSFDWGYDISYGRLISGGTTLVTGNYSGSLTDYDPNRTVHYRFKVYDGTSYTYGTDQSFNLAELGVGGIPYSNYQLNQGMLVVFAGASIFMIMRAFQDSTVAGIIVSVTLIFLYIALLIGMNGAVNNLL